jgi:hypothetical protein
MLAALILSFSFDGGEAIRLASAASIATDLPVVLYMGDDETKPKANFEIKSLDDFGSFFTAHTGLLQAEDSGLAFHSPGYSLDLIMRNHSDFGKSWQRKNEGFFLAADGKISTGLSGASTDLGQLEQVKFSKPVKTHWFLKSARIATRAIRTDEKVFLGMVSKAVGGKLVETTGNYSIELDPDQVRQRGSFTYQAFAQKSQDNFSIADSLFSSEALASLTDEQIYKLYEKPESQLILTVKNRSRLFNLALAKRAPQPILNSESGGPSGSNPTYRTASQSFLSIVNLKADGQALFFPNRPPEFQLPDKNKPNHWYGL